MPKIKLTAATIRDLPTPAAGQVLYTDETLAGFGLRVGTTSRVYYAESRVNGRTRRTTIGPASVFTPDQARKEAKKLLGQMAGGVDVNASKAEARAKTITLQQALDRYLAARTLKPKTADDYRAALRNGCPDWLPREMQTITPALFVARHRKITETRGPHIANGFSRVVRAVWNYALHDTAKADGTPTLPINPTARLSALKGWNKVQARQTYLPADRFPALQAFLTAERERNPDSPLPDFVETLLRTGLRRREAAGLRWKDVDLTARTLTLPTTKNGRSHTLPLPDQLLELLTRRKAAANGEHVFAASGKVLDCRHTLDRLRAAVGIDLTYHDCRRTFASLADSLDLSGYAIKAMLNHAATGDVTAAHYIVRSVDRLREPMQRISDRIDALMTGKGEVKPASAPITTAPIEISRMIS